MTVRLGVVMDDIATIKVKKDSTLAMMLEAQKRHYEIFYIQQHDLLIQDQTVSAKMCGIKVYDNEARWFELGETSIQPLSNLHVILMRKDPPVDMQYIYTTQLLELAERAGVLVINKPQSLRDFNEKLFITWFPQCCVETIVTCDMSLIKNFLAKHHDIIVKPLYGMGGTLVFRIRESDPNVNVILETLTQKGKERIMVQRFIPEISQGDKRILMIDGKPFPYALARIPAAGETRANLVTGGHGVGVALSARDQWICEQVAPTLIEKGLLFVGLDVIGDYLTEINVTSPTCIRELDKIYNANISAEIFDRIEKKLQSAV